MSFATLDRDSVSFYLMNDIAVSQKWIISEREGVDNKSFHVLRIELSPEQIRVLLDGGSID